MLKLIEKINELVKKLNPKREDIIPFILSIGITVIFLVDYNFLNNRLLSGLLVLEVIMLTFLILMIMFMAGFTVMKSLSIVAAEISLLIFLAQSYCAIPNRVISGDNALKTLLLVGILYISFYFFHSLYKGLTEKYKKFKDEKRSLEKIIIIILFLFFIGFYVWIIYQVIKPIILNLCIYK